MTKVQQMIAAYEQHQRSIIEPLVVKPEADTANGTVGISTNNGVCGIHGYFGPNGLKQIVQYIADNYGIVAKGKP